MRVLHGAVLRSAAQRCKRSAAQSFKQSDFSVCGGPDGGSAALHAAVARASPGCRDFIVSALAA